VTVGGDGRWRQVAVGDGSRCPEGVLRVGLCWAGGTEVVGFGFVIIFFNVMRHIAEDMTDPYGNDATDYHVQLA